jgi:hypothetical protein
MAKRRGRPGKPGKRKPCGRLAAARAVADGGNDKVRAMRAAFAVFQDGKAGNELGDPIGKAWAAGLLEGHGADGQAMRDAGRDYGRLWRSCFGELGARTSSPERLARVAPGPVPASSGPPSAGELRFERMKAIVEAMPAAHRQAFYALCVEGQDPDSLPPFIARLIAERLALKGKAEGAGPVPGDRERLEQAAEVLEALVAGTRRQRAA